MTESFEDLGLGPELVEALAAEGIERPTPLQEAAVPVLRRGHNLVLAAGPGAGTLVAWGAALLDRLEAGGGSPRGLVLTPTAEAAERSAESLARLASATGHTVAALGSPWVLPARADLLFGTPADVLAAAGNELTLNGIEALVVDQAGAIEALGGLSEVESVVDFLPKDGQRVVVALPPTERLGDFVERHARRAATVPPRPADGSPVEKAPARGTVHFRTVQEPREEGVLATVHELLEDGARHVLVFSRSEDRAADLGDYLTLHGYHAGAPGDADVPVWLGVDALEARSAAAGAEGLRVVSADAPAGPDDLDRRHALAEGGVVIVLPREIPHLRDVARRTGYELQTLPLAARPATGDLDALRDALARAVDEEDVAAYQLVLQPLFERFDPAEVAAAATALLRRKAPVAPPAAPARKPEARPAPAWVKVFLSVGEQDGLTPGDLVGAITGEANVSGKAVGRIDIRERHTLVEIRDAEAQGVIRALNGTTIRGRAVRADIDRGRPAGGRGRPPRHR